MRGRRSKPFRIRHPRIRWPGTTDESTRPSLGRAPPWSLDAGGNTFVETMLEADQRFLQSAPQRRSIFVLLTTDANPVANVRTDLYNRFMKEFVARGGRAHAVVIGGVNSGLITQVAENLVQ